MKTTGCALIKDINDSNDTLPIEAWVLRKWFVLEKAPPQAIWKVGMILVNGQRNLIQRYETFPVEGVVYHFENFKVLENTNYYKVTAHPYKLSFHNSTYCKECDAQIPSNAFNFVPLRDIANYKASNPELIDVIGFLNSFGNLYDQRREYDVVKRLNFTISDKEKNDVCVVLFGNCASVTFNSRTHDLKSPIVVLVCFAKINFTTGYGHISNVFDAIKVIFNPDIPEAKILINSLNSDPTKIGMFLLITRNGYRHKGHHTKGGTAYGWKYDGCKCDAKPQQDKEKLFCKKRCQAINETHPKFKVHYKVYDSNRKCSVIFFNRLAKELLGTTTEIQAKKLEKETTFSFPKDLENCVGKELVVRLKGSSDEPKKVKYSKETSTEENRLNKDSARASAPRNLTIDMDQDRIEEVEAPNLSAPTVASRRGCKKLKKEE
ncbi:replication protein A 70 kDa DNA-binding subunit D-like [Neltuma alba]|uniref:replication protein A 70 kDa DNA-binding subunit D-like n=1 Tax=Neltuma alba TaxID=207710 RepID=UPI0010A40316|nr:replication protein A 70 kDa DNA-binding subunit D-like [Prosopis alba]